MAEVALHSDFLKFHKFSQLLIVNRHHLNLGLVLSNQIESQLHSLVIHVGERAAFNRDNLVVFEEGSHIRHTTLGLGFVDADLDHFFRLFGLCGEAGNE